MKTKDPLEKIAEFPVAMRAQLADEILRTLNPLGSGNSNGMDRRGRTADNEI